MKTTTVSKSVVVFLFFAYDFGRDSSLGASTGRWKNVAPSNPPFLVVVVVVVVGAVAVAVVRTALFVVLVVAQHFGISWTIKGNNDILCRQFELSSSMWQEKSKCLGASLQFQLIPHCPHKSSRNHRIPSLPGKF